MVLHTISFFLHCLTHCSAFGLLDLPYSFHFCFEEGFNIMFTIKLLMLLLHALDCNGPPCTIVITYYNDSSICQHLLYYCFFAVFRSHRFTSFLPVQLILISSFLIFHLLLLLINCVITSIVVPWRCSPYLSRPSKLLSSFLSIKSRKNNN